MKSIKSERRKVAFRSSRFAKWLYRWGVRGGEQDLPPHKNGFALIELMVVVAVLSVAAAFLVPRFLKHQIQRKQDECQTNLLSLLEAEKDYFQKNNEFTEDLDALGWKPQGKGFYRYQFLPQMFPQAQKTGFLFECSGNIDKDPTLDQATIDETGWIIHVSDDTKK